MKFIVSILLTALLSFSICLYFDWWTITLAAFIVAICIKQRPLLSFLTGFISLFLLWGILSLLMDGRNDHILSARLSSVLPFGGSLLLTILVTALAGALPAGFAALAGSYLRSVR